MLKNYFVVALRSLRRQKGYAGLNVAGLAVGLASCLLIGLWVRHERGYDRFHTQSERIYRAQQDPHAADGWGAARGPLFGSDGPYAR